MNIRTVEPACVVPWRLKIGGFKPDQCTKFGGMRDGEIENNASADRTSHHHRPVERQCAAERANSLGIAGGGQPVLVAGPTSWQIGLAVPRHVKRDDPKMLRKSFICQQVAPLPSIRTCGMQTYQRNSAAALLEVNAVDFVFDLDMHVAPDDRLDKSAHVAALTLPRGNASTSLKNCRWLMNGNRSPSKMASPLLVSANKSCHPGRGIGLQNSAHAPGAAQ